MKRLSGGKLTRAALRDAAYSCCPGFTRARAGEMVEAVLEEISEALVRGEPVQLQAFGRFDVRARRGRTGRNPRTGVEAAISPRRVISFRPSPILIARINGKAISETEDGRARSNTVPASALGRWPESGAPKSTADAPHADLGSLTTPLCASVA